MQVQGNVSRAKLYFVVCNRQEDLACAILPEDYEMGLCGVGSSEQELQDLGVASVLNCGPPVAFESGAPKWTPVQKREKYLHTLPVLEPNSAARLTGTQENCWMAVQPTARFSTL